MQFGTLIILGRLAQDVKLRYSQAGTPIGKLGIAVHVRQKLDDGKWGNETVFFDVTCFGRDAESIHRNIGKGDPILVEAQPVVWLKRVPGGSDERVTRWNMVRFSFVTTRGGKTDRGDETETAREVEQPGDDWGDVPL